MTTWIINEMTYLVLFGEVRSLLRSSDFAERQEQIHHSLIIHVFTSGLGNWNSYSLQRNTVCFNGDINVHFFPPLQIFWWNLDVYMLDDICNARCILQSQARSSRPRCCDGISFKVASQGKSPCILQAKHLYRCIVLLCHFTLPVDMIFISI